MLLWSTLKSAVFGLSSSLPPSIGGGLVRESVGKADLFFDHFDGKQSGDLPPLSSGRVRSGVSR